MTNGSLSKPGILVSARGREWVVLPDSTDELLLVRPVGGLDEETAGVIPSVEPVSSATFSLPTKEDVGDFASGRLLRDAARLSTRAAAGPFRSFGRIAAEPRPYQLVPLMMALKLDPVRLLIADDVGIGKTIEAALIARELIDRGEVGSLAVLCPPQLAEQWQRELREKFHLEAELVLSSTIQRLERDLPLGTSVFDRHPITVVSTDFIKSRGRAADFVNKCPELVIVDEAHGCTLAGGVGHGRQQRHDLLKQISSDPSRHLLLLTATPHSGNEEAFRSLLSLLNEEFAELPNDLDSAEREGVRRKLARHLVQRRRADIRHYLETDTSFPSRLEKEAKYKFSDTYRQLFEDIFNFARSYVQEEDGGRRRRVRYWSALGLLRCVSSSPMAAAATLRSRAATNEATDEEEVDEIGRRTVLDQGEDDDGIIVDFSPGTGLEGAEEQTRRKLLEFARRAESIGPAEDNKLAGAVQEIKDLLRDGFRPVVFCRFVGTAEYLKKNLIDALPNKIRVDSVTGNLPPAEREDRIKRLVEEDGQYVLVCTDCLSEGINLQNSFDAVLHYDLAWNPTRHEQREGRVDRFGQSKSEVRVVTYFGSNNPIDGVILDVLIRKHMKIKSDLGVAVAVPGSSEQIAETLFEGALFRERARLDGAQRTLDFLADASGDVAAIHSDWENAAEKEKATRSRFAQQTLQPEEVAVELARVRSAIGRKEDVSNFVDSLVHAASVPSERDNGSIKLHVSKETPRSLRQAIGRDEPFSGGFDMPLRDGDVYLCRTSPVVEGLATWTLDQALDPMARDGKSVASRCGVVATSSVSERTILLVARFRSQLSIGRGANALLCEEILPLACRGPADEPAWLSELEGERLLGARPERNLIRTAIIQQLELLLPALPRYLAALELVAEQRAQVQLEAHQRVREASRTRGQVSITPVLPVDILGAYVLLPKA